jgi:hypothetical protein
LLKGPKQNFRSLGFGSLLFVHTLSFALLSFELHPGRTQHFGQVFIHTTHAHLAEFCDDLILLLRSGAAPYECVIQFSMLTGRQIWISQVN